MKYTALLEKDNNGYKVTIPGLPDCQTRGDTQEEALDKARIRIAEVLSRTQIITVEVDIPGNPGPQAHPWERFAGIWKNDPTFDRFLNEIAVERREKDAGHEAV